MSGGPNQAPEMARAEWGARDRGAPERDAPERVPRVAIVHDYITQRGGAERLVAHLAGLLPDATIHASVVDPAVLPPSLVRRGVRTGALQPLARLGVPLRAIAPLLPVAFRTLRVRPVDVVLSSSSAFGHHVRPPAGAVHVVYCHTPPRFLWHSEEYVRPGSPTGLLAAAPFTLLRWLDRRAAARADLYIANSAHTAAEIRRAYGREALVIHPPVETAAFTPTAERSGRFLVVARLKPHKRIDLAIAAANRLGAPLDVVGEGPDVARLRRLAGSTVRFLGRLPDDAVRAAMARTAGLIVPAREDFGMTMAEVQAAGRPPIAFAAGGALEIVQDGETGFLFPEQTPAAIAAAMTRALTEPLATDALVASARRFDTAVFDAAITGLIERIGSPAAVEAAAAAAARATAAGSWPC